MADFGRWTVIGPARRRNGKAALPCRCNCGTERLVESYSLHSGRSKSCGCLDRELSSARKRTHGLSSDPLYAVWFTARKRCTDANYIRFKDWGGRGIRMAAEWINDFPAFYAFITSELGPKPGPEYSLDRINNDSGYEPGNLRWATPAQQANNRRAA